MNPVYYNVYDYGSLMGTYTVTDLQQMIHCGRQIPGECAAAGRTYRARYRFEQVQIDEDNSEWACVTERLKASGYDLSRIHIVGPGQRGGDNSGYDRK